MAIAEIAGKVPTKKIDELTKPIEIALGVLAKETDGCTISELRDKMREEGVSGGVITDTVVALMLAEKATYTGNRSRTVKLANIELERSIINALYENKQGYTFDELLKAAEDKGVSADDLRRAITGEYIRNRVIDEDGKIKSRIQGPPAVAKQRQRTEPGANDERYYEELWRTTYDFRSEFAKDRERIIYSSAFRRLAGVTQVFGTAQGHVFHNRLTHSIKAGQIARSIAEQLGHVDVHPDVVEAAALAHDLGHPPFGHTGEKELDDLLRKHGVIDGYEGNAQNLRIVTQLSRVRSEFRGLNLTRATLNALMKYPWLRGTEEQTKKHRKWNAYSTEKRFFEFARSRMQTEEKSDEAQVMEWADDIAYAVHDIEDGVRARMIPLNELLNDPGEFLEGSKDWWGNQPCFSNSQDKDEDAKSAFNIFNIAAGDLRRPYDDDAAQQAALRQLTTVLHHRYTLAVTREDNRLLFRPEYKREVTILKGLMRFYVFCNPVLLPQQHGQRRVISDLFGYFFKAAKSDRDRNVLPSRVRELFDEDYNSLDQPARDVRAARAAADTVAGMTELEALAMHRRVTGTDAGRIRERIVS